MIAQQLRELLDLLDKILLLLEDTSNSEEHHLETLMNQLKEKTRNLWKLHEQGKIVTDLEPLTRVIKDFFISELPQAIKDVNSRDKVKKELTLSKKLIQDVLQPKVVES